MNPIDDLLLACRDAVRAGGAELLAWQGRVHPQEKAPRDFVTEADFASQRAVQKVISSRFPEHGIVAEESEAELSPRSSGWQWFIDPLDGTTNFVHGLPYFAVSVAVALDGDVVAGAVLDPVRNECFSAARGLGAHLGDEALQTSSVQTLEDALLAFSLPASVKQGDSELSDLMRMAAQCQGLRRFGAAALNLCYVAASRLDGYFARRLHPWDLAAGSLMVEEAGGAIASLGKSTVELWDPGIVAAAGESLLDELRRELL